MQEFDILEREVIAVEPQKFNSSLLLDLTRKLTGIILQEADLLKNMKISAIAGLQQEKNETAGYLAILHKELRENPSMRESLSDIEKTTLKEASFGFDSAVTLYQQELAKAKKVNELVVGTIVNAMRDNMANARPYTSNGTLGSQRELARNAPAVKFSAQA